MHPDVRLLGGRYELAGLIATGGMGQVWQARDVLLGRDVAVKVLRSEFTGDPTFLARFRAEAQLAAALVHPNIAALFDYGEVLPADPTQEHLAYLVMELVRGESLSSLLHRERTLPPQRALDVLRQSAAGLAAAHAAGVVHRDVKPGNVLIGADGTVKITDFGVAVSGSSVPLTQTGQVIGTPHYLSPEQASGARATPASDVYALGVIGYQCLSGRRVFDAESSLQVLLMQLHGTPDPLPDDVPAPVRRLVEHALAKDPAHRYPDGASFRDAIDDVLAGRPPRNPPTAPTSTLPEPPVDAEEPAGRRRRRVLVPLLALLAVAVVGLTGFQLIGGPGDATVAAADTAAPSGTAAAPVDVVSADLVGRPYTEVQAELTARGLQVTLRPLQTGDVPDGQVIAVDPTGPLAPGTPVTLTYAVAPPVAPAPAPAPAPVQTLVTDTSSTGTATGGGSAATGAEAPAKGPDEAPAKAAPPGHGKGGGPAKGKGEDKGGGPGKGEGKGKG